MSLPNPLPEVRLAPLAYTMHHWLEWRDHEQFDFDAPYQRGHVWDETEKRALIKSLLLGIPVGNIVLAKRPSGEEIYARVVDGKQRITALRDWGSGRLSVPGWWFQPEALSGGEAARSGDVKVDDLSTSGRRALENRHMPALEFESHIEWIENPDYDPDWSGDRSAPQNRRWLTRHRSEEAALRAEAEVYLLVNFGGIEQTDEDRARAEALASSP